MEAFNQKITYRQWQHILLKLFSKGKMPAPDRFSAIFADFYMDGKTPTQAWDAYLNKVFNRRNSL